MSRIASGKTEKIRCDAPQVGEMVYDYFNGALDAIRVREFERHLISCRHCESVVHELDDVMMFLPEDAGRETHHSGLTGLGGQTQLLEKLCF